MADDEITFEEATQAPDEVTFEEASQPPVSPAAAAAALPFAVTAPLQAVGALRNVIENPAVGAASEMGRRQSEEERQTRMAQFATEAGALPTETFQPTMAALGTGLERAGKLTRGVLADVPGIVAAQKFRELGLEPPEELEPTRNVEAALRGEQLPAEREAKFLPPALRMVESAAGGLVESGPRLAAVAGLEAVGIPAPVAAAAIFGTTPRGFEPQQAAIAAALPFVGKYGGEITEALATKLGISNTQAVNLFKAMGGTAAAAGYMGAIEESEIEKLPPEQRKDARVDALANIMGQVALGPIGVEFKKANPAELAGIALGRMVRGTRLASEEGALFERVEPERPLQTVTSPTTGQPVQVPKSVPTAPEGWKFDGERGGFTTQSGVKVPAEWTFTRTVKGEETSFFIKKGASPEEIKAAADSKVAEFKQPEVSPHDLKPALRTKEGRIIEGQKGQVHDDIYKSLPGTEGLELKVEQPEHGFMYKGEFLSRSEASKLLGEKEPLHSEDLIELQNVTPQQAKSFFEQYNDLQKQMADLQADKTLPMEQKFARMGELSKQIEALKNLDASPEKGNSPKGMPPKEPVAQTEPEKPLSETEVEPLTTPPEGTTTPQRPPADPKLWEKQGWLEELADGGWAAYSDKPGAHLFDTKEEAQNWLASQAQPSAKSEPIPAEYSTTTTPETPQEQAEQQRQVAQQTETTQQESHESVSHYTDMGPGNETGVEMSRHGTATGLPPGVPGGSPRFPQELLAASHRLGTVVRTKATLRPGVLGQYVHARAGVANSDKIEVGDLHNQLTVAHEMGHDLDQLLWPQVNLAKTQKSFIPRAGSFGTPKEIFDELKPISELMRGPMTGSKGHIQYRRAATELIADFFALYAHDPGRARSMAPKFSKAFEAALARNPDAEQVIRELHAGNVTPASPQPGQPAVPAAAGMPGKVPARPAPVTASRDAQVLVSSQGLVKGLVRLFEAFVQRARVDSDNWRVLVKKQADRNDVGAFVEGIGNLEIPGDTRAAVVNRMTPAKYEMAKQYTFAIEDQRGTINRFLEGTTDGEYLDFLNDYLPHFYVNSKTPAAKEAVSRWSKNSPNAKQRQIPTLQEAVGLGLTPISQDPAVLYELHARINWRVAVNRKLIAELGDMKTAGGQPVLVPWGKQPGGYVQSNNPLIQRVYAMKSGGATMLWRGGAGIHPDAWPAVRQMLETPSSWTVSQYYDALNSITRANAFAFSMFHDLTLRFASVGTQWSWYNPARGLFRVFERNPTTGELEIFRSTRGLGKELLMSQDTVADAALHGLKFSWTDSESYERNARDFLEQAAARYRDVPYLGTGVRLARDFQHMRQEGLWRNTHDAYKIAAYNDLVSKALQDAPPGTNSYEVKSRIASLLNDTFGGQEWQTKFWLSPQARRTMARFFLAPDWTFSTLRSVPFLSDAFSVVRGQAPRVIGRETKPTPREGIGGNLGRLRFWGGEIAALAMATLSAQYAIYHAFGRKEKGDKEWVWDNEEGQKRRIDVTPIMRQMPWHDKNDPTRYYVNLGKRPEEIIGWVTHSDQNIYAKLARPVAEVIRQITGTEGDFKAQWKRDHESFAESIGSRSKSAGGTLIPFVFAGNQFALSLPYRKGMTKYKAQQAYESVYELAADPGRFTKAWAFLRGVPSPEGTLREMVETITDAAERNGVQADPVRKRALSEVRGKYYDAYFKAYDKGDQKAFEKSAQALHNLGATAPQMSRSLHRREELKPFLPP